MGQPESAERHRVTAIPESEDHAGGLSLTPPPFQLFADGDDGSGQGGGDAGSGSESPLQRQVASTAAAQLEGEYAEFPGALDNLLTATEDTSGSGGPGHPGTYYDHVPTNCYTTLWDIYKALHWRASFGRSAQEWARAAITAMQGLQTELTANGVLGAPLVTRVTTALAPILNPLAGSAEGTGMEAVFSQAIDSNLLVGPRTARDARAVRTHEQFAAQLRAVMVASANILSPELYADAPMQILNAESPYNYLRYHGNDAVPTNYYEGLQRLYQARWEVSDAAARQRKVDWARQRFTRLLRGTATRQMLEALTTLDTAGVDAQLAAIQAGIQQYVLNRMEAVKVEPVGTPIARNGQPITARAPRTGGGGGRRRAADPIVYDEGTTVTAWNPNSVAYTSAQAREELGDNPHMTLHGQNIGPYSRGGKKYPYVYGGRAYEIIVRTTGRLFFGIKYVGGSSMTVAAINQLLASTEPSYFNEAQRVIVNSVRPHVSSEGGISSINTWDKQDLTIAGRGEDSGRISIMIRAAQRLMEEYGTPVTQLTRVQQLVDELSVDSPEGTAGPNGIRFDMPRIHELVELLETPEIHRAMTLAKLNDAIVGFFGEAFENGDEATLYNHDVDAADEARMLADMRTNQLHPVIIGIAIHNRLGGSGFGNPMEYAMRANRAHPQRPAYVNAGRPDYERLSMQVAYLGKIRIQNKRSSRSGMANIATSSFTIMFSQKIADFNNHFSGEGAEMENGAYFNMAAATSVMPFWTGERTFTESSARPGADRLIITNEDEHDRVHYYDCGPLLPADVTSLGHDTTVEEDAPEQEVEEDTTE